MTPSGNGFYARFFFDNAVLKCDGVANSLAGYQYADGGGVFNQWQLFPDRVEVSNDFFGFRPLYYKATADCLRISEDINQLVDPAEPLNFRALAVFLRSGDFLGEHTPFLAIKVLPPDARLTFDINGINLQVKQKNSSTGMAVSLEQLHRDYKEIFSASIAQSRQLIGQRSCLVPLSGGRDSRHIVLELHAQHQQLSCATVKHQPPKSNEDFNVAALLAKHLTLPHVALQQSLSYQAAELIKNRLTSYCALEHSWFLPLYNHIKLTQTAFVFDGIGGDILSTGSTRLTAERLLLARAGRWDELAEELLGPEGYLADMLAPSLSIKLSRQQAVADMSLELARFTDSANPIAQFFFWNRARRTIGSSAFGLLGRVCTPVTPFLDQRLYHLLSNVPAEFFLQQGKKQVHDKLIASCYPGSVGIRYEDKTVTDNHSYLTTRIKENLQQVAYLSCHKPAGLKISPLLSRVPKRIISANFHHGSEFLVRTALYLHSLEQITEHGII
ncbi:asparagine synthase C-terminal domain-containing protein [Arsukibacterium perlucidum]|uniref:asparagine synthase-related protein n=1 Tax=Arsukibacterium perlucidum TaxID=368811 RepID=UPI000371FA1D|nr:asparagine synthase C-terminal domain-containing protein [Arsukibacterium perlucidum]